ncbi:MAG: UDP-N-acetylmuramoyl-L-alanyl-D-glutamate--2,6-diaminopimelate ligase [Alphaproteobacteria bacterium]|jgi:UDP-N-acetylmuramoyl-L-alanyl-D-glutamate--2,6-diaminopimelate ligase|nr:UDP-N-acetylmuramoyl-L-alanyl-D-glutamate--2,6-diaminopimelate ligase [Alphaproteobacteria bacterium]
MVSLSVLLDRPALPDLDIKEVSCDSRSLGTGALFAALPGIRSNGLDFVPAAIRNGAVAVLVPKGSKKPDGADSLVWIEDENPRQTLAHVAARFYGSQPAHIVAVTGTNGKTSVVSFAQDLWQKMGFKAASLGTLGLRGEGLTGYGSMTTPDSVRLHAHLADLSASGFTHVAMEASSHGIDQYRLDGVKIEAAGFTNLTRDHLDYHQTMEAYGEAKMRLFRELLPQGAPVVVNSDTPEAVKIKTIATERGLPFWGYGIAGDKLKLLSRLPTPEGQKLDLEILGRRVTLTLPLVGGFQVMNVLCAAGLVLAQNESRMGEVIDLLPTLRGVPGRLQLVSGSRPNTAVYVDYAHTPDALENILLALRPHTKGRLFCLFGCGGDRDRGKRPVMGALAARLADVAIITDDNPRSEDPAAIRAAIHAAAPAALVIPDRREAIRKAIGFLESGDVLVLAGKGHEQGQIFADHVEPFDDVNEAHLAMQNAS